MRKFKIGDKVRITANWTHWNSDTVALLSRTNGIGTVEDIDDGLVWVFVDEGVYPLTLLETDIELADKIKETNPKDAIGSDKLPLHLWPTTATAMGSIALLNGALKYGRSNFREIGIRASIYKDAAHRHLDAWFEGEEVDPDDGVPHLAAVLACVAIIVDAQAAGKLNDDRMVAGGYRDFNDKMTEHVKRLKELHKAKNPKHYTIADSKDKK